MVSELDLKRELADAKKMLAALSRLPEESTPLEHGRAIAERLKDSAYMVACANAVLSREDGEA